MKEIASLGMLTLFSATAGATVNIEMVPVGNPGNATDTRYEAIGLGSVSYSYRMGKYEVTVSQYAEFLNAVAKADPNELYSAAMGDFEGTEGPRIERVGSSPNFSYSVADEWANWPVNWVSFWDAARFANWLHNGQLAGPQGPGTTEDGAYHDIGNPALFGRNAGARFFIPTMDEWYKAAYHDQTAGLSANYFDYPTGTDSLPGNDIYETTNSGNNANHLINDDPNMDDYAIGPPYFRTAVGEFELSDSPYGTFDQGGNLWEWNESAAWTLPHGLHGGSAYTIARGMRASFRFDYGFDPRFENLDVGFRVAGVIPEPNTLLLATICGLGALPWMRAR